VQYRSISYLVVAFVKLLQLQGKHDALLGYFKKLLIITYLYIVISVSLRL